MDSRTRAKASGKSWSRTLSSSLTRDVGWFWLWFLDFWGFSVALACFARATLASAFFRRLNRRSFRILVCSCSPWSDIAWYFGSSLLIPCTIFFMRLRFRFSGSPKTPWSTRVVSVLSANLSVGFFSFFTFFDIVSQNLQKQYYVMNVFYHKNCMN